MYHVFPSDRRKSAPKELESDRTSEAWQVDARLPGSDDRSIGRQDKPFMTTCVILV